MDGNNKNLAQQSIDYRHIEKAIKFIEANHKSQPTVDQIAKSVKLSKYHLDKLFNRWAGISSKQFLQFLTLEYTQQKLIESRNLLDTALDVGLSGYSCLHDLFVTYEAITPGEFKPMGSGLKMQYGFPSTPFGECLLAITDRGICHLSFVADNNRSMALNHLQQNWPNAKWVENQLSISLIVNRIFSLKSNFKSGPFHLLLKGTNFQIKVWRALLTIPIGNILSYQDIAAYIGNPKATRAVGNAIAANPVAYLIPCHRVIAGSGKIHRYRGGTARKKAMLGWEATKVELR